MICAFTSTKVNIVEAQNQCNAAGFPLVGKVGQLNRYARSSAIADIETFTNVCPLSKLK